MNAHSHYFEKGQRRLIPPVLVACFALLNVATLPLLHHLPFSFGLAEAAIFYWALLLPSLVPYWLLFALGIMTDAVTGGIFGLHAVSFMTVRLLGAEARPFVPRHQLPFCTLAFAAMYGVVCVISFLLTAYFSPSGLTALPVFAGWLASVGIYPVLSLIFHRVLKAMTSRRY